LLIAFRTTVEAGSEFCASGFAVEALVVSLGACLECFGAAVIVFLATFPVTSLLKTYLPCIVKHLGFQSTFILAVLETVLIVGRASLEAFADTNAVTFWRGNAEAFVAALNCFGVAIVAGAGAAGAATAIIVALLACTVRFTGRNTEPGITYKTNLATLKLIVAFAAESTTFIIATLESSAFGFARAQAIDTGDAGRAGAAGGATAVVATDFVVTGRYTFDVLARNGSVFSCDRITGGGRCVGSFVIIAAAVAGHQSQPKRQNDNQCQAKNLLHVPLLSTK